MVQRIAADECPHKLPHGLLWTPEGGLADSVCVEWDADHSPQEVSAWSRWNLGNYRFRQGYTMRDDGTLLPFLELGGQLFDYWDGTGTQPPWTACTTQPSGGGTSACRSHFHTAYWRFDFDVDTALGNQAEAFTWTDVEATNQDGAIPPCSPETSASWCAWPTETHADRNLPGFTKWRITNPTSKNSFGNPRSVELQPLGEGGPTDTSTHDVRAVAYKCHATLPQCEMGYEVRNGGRTDDTALDAYANGESLSPGDVVLWYAQRVHHEVRDEDIPHMVTHALGPVISTRNLVAGNPTN
jgi:Cu2+-containing amine oxidase